MKKGPDPKEMLEDIRSAETAENGIELSEWEEEFVSSCELSVRKKRGLSDKQLEKLEEIWDRI